MSRITPNAFGYLACLLDQKGSASLAKKGWELRLQISGCNDPKLRKDLDAWIGGSEVIREAEGDRRGCTTHCKHPHIHYARSTYVWIVTGTRALILLYNLEPSLRTWDEKFADKYDTSMAYRKDWPKSITKDMAKKGWEIPPIPQMFAVKQV